MLEVIISWLYIGLVCLCLGLGVGRLLQCHNLIKRKIGLVDNIIVGIVAVTVLGEFFSIFAGIALLFQIIILLLCVICILYCRNDLHEIKSFLTKLFHSYEGLFCVLMIIGIAYFTSRGTFHTDTNIYHANNIRIYEELGLIKGMANLQWQFGYNSAYLAFASVFSFGWLLDNPIHSTTGFLEVIFVLWACHSLKNYRKHQSHIGDFCKIGILIYVLVIITGSMSPATDYGAMLFAAFLIARWVCACEATADEYEFAFLSVIMVFTLTLKVSAGLLVLVALFPGIVFIKKNQWKAIVSYLLMGIVVVAPFFIRNYYISGWLIYPFAGIDIFNPDWKVPIEILRKDAAQITTYGRCVNDPNLLDMPITEWIHVWWSGQQYYEKMLVYFCILGVLLLAINFISDLRKGKRKIEIGMLFLRISLLASLLLWFFEAPFIRYGLIFMLMLPLIEIGELLSSNRHGMFRLVTSMLVICMTFCLTPYMDNYFEDFGVFVKQNIKEPYYLQQKEFDYLETDTVVVEPFMISTPEGAGELNSYYTFPSSAYESEVLMIEARGTTLREGFRNKAE